VSRTFTEYVSWPMAVVGMKPLQKAVLALAGSDCASGTHGCANAADATEWFCEPSVSQHSVERAPHTFA